MDSRGTGLFYAVKEIMTTCPILAFLDFTKPFMLQCDASRKGVGVLLMQEKHPIAYESRKLRGPERSFSIYDKEMLAIMHALAKLREYLVGNKFCIKTDHNSLRHFLG